MTKILDFRKEKSRRLVGMAKIAEAFDVPKFGGIPEQSAKLYQDEQGNRYDATDIADAVLDKLSSSDLHLYVFRSYSEHYTGVAGVVASSISEAKGLVTEAQKEQVAYSDPDLGEVKVVRVPSEPFLTEQEYAKSEQVNCWLLVKVFDLARPYPRGVLFCDWTD